MYLTALLGMIFCLLWGGVGTINAQTKTVAGTVSDDKCYKLTVGDHPVIYYKTTVDVEDVRAYVIACYIYSGDMLTMFTAQLYDAESFEAWNSAINEMTISGEQLGSAMTAE